MNELCFFLDLALNFRFLDWMFSFFIEIGLCDCKYIKIYQMTPSFFSSKPSSPLQRLGRLMRSYRCIAALKAASVAEASSSIVSYMLIKEKRWFCKWSPINHISIFLLKKNNCRKVSLFWLATILKMMQQKPLTVAGKVKMWSIFWLAFC